MPEDQAVGDYEKSARLLAPYADYLVVNVSSPNTPGLRDLQAVEKLEPLLAAVRATADDATEGRDAGCRCWSRSPPTSPTTTCSRWPTWPTALGLDGIIATNTTISRDGLASDPADGRARSVPAGCPGGR